MTTIIAAWAPEAAPKLLGKGRMIHMEAKIPSRSNGKTRTET